MAPFNENKEHYESLITLHKYNLGIAAALLAFFATGIGILSFLNGKELKDAQESARAYQQVEINALKDDLRNQSQTLSQNLTNIAENASDMALNEIENTRISSARIAREQSESTVMEVLEKQNIEEFIDVVVSERYLSKLNIIVDNKITEIDQININKAIENIFSTSYLRRKEGIEFLKANREANISDENLKVLVEIMESVDEWDDITYDILAYLEMSNSPSVTEYFTRIINRNPQNTEYFSSVRYFLFNDFGYNLIRESMDNYPKVDRLLPYYYQRLVAESAKYNTGFTLNLLNEKEYINKLKSYSEENDKDFIHSYKEPLLNSLTPYLTKDEINSTYFSTIY